ncbi:proprotein convertase P-domain-containing protein [Phaeodactylibacter luteus]|uniref:T9SS type B sorting domain-containing protein n=1 Tax=Phaeodactylibacter luteus TaxID=1564516 RepID=A0A5C6RIR9_9BACT|nr:proprotein convertase P-domain-containing protein [Phaeodactylibacter luteus]TXB62191.1 T9SS type B sorting domain-containing protein [Phaeodactylibacter luteus]
MSVSTKIVFACCFSLLGLQHLAGQSYIMGQDAMITACDGVFLDSGGNNGTYSANEDLEVTICPSGAGENVQLTFANINVQPGDVLCFYDGEDTAAPQLSCSDQLTYGNGIIIQATAANPSGCVTITFQSDGAGEDTGWSAGINCIQDCQLIYSDLASTDPLIEPADTGYIDICPGDRVTLSGMGVYPQNDLFYNQSDQTSTFEWNFGDGTTAVGPNVSHVFNEPGGYTIQLTITDEEGCQNTNFLSQRVRVSTYPEYNFGVAIQAACIGDTISLTGTVDTAMTGVDVSAAPVEGSFQQGGTRSDTLLLPDGTGASYQTSIALNQFPPGAVLSDAALLTSICLDMEHSYGGDLDIEVICPNGQSVYILDFPSGVGSTNFGEPYATSPVDGQSSNLTPGVPYSYCFSMTDTDFGTLPDEAGNFNYNYTTVPSNGNGQTHTYSDSYFPEGVYLPQESFAGLEGCPLNGEWTIRVQDNLGADNGWLFQWGINFDASLFARLETFTPQITNWGWVDNPTLAYYSQDSIAAVPQNAGTVNYTFMVENDFGCTFDTTVTIPLLPATHPDCYSCEEIFSMPMDTVICEGESVAFDVSTSTGGIDTITFETIPLEPFGAANYPNSNPFRPTINVNSIAQATLTDPAAQIESVCLNITTEWNADINLFLEAPDGQVLELSTGNGGGSMNYVNTCFTPTAPQPITAGTGPFTGDYLPEGNFAALTGSPINGTWTLRASDAFAPNFVGEFTSWSISFITENDVNYAWSGAGLSCNDCPDPIATPTQTTDYILTATDSYNCEAIDTVTVTVISDAPAPEVECNMASLTALSFTWTAVPGYTEYEYRITINDIQGDWEGPTTDLSYLLNGVANGDEVLFEVRVYTGGAVLDCPVEIGSATCGINFCDLALAQDTLINPSCFGFSDGEALFSTTGGTAPITFSLNGGMAQDTGLFTNLAAGDYELIATDNFGCADTLTFGLTEPDTLTANIQVTNLIACHGAAQGAMAVTANGGTGLYAYEWSTGPAANGPAISDLEAGSYSVTVTDENGCTAVESAALVQPDSIVIELTLSPPNCNSTFDGSIQAIVSGGVPDYSYLWSNMSTTQEITSLNGGAYCLTVTDGNNCVESICTTLSAPNALAIDTILATPALCNGGNTGTATVISSGGTAPYAFEWNDPLNQIDSAATMLEAGAYTVLITDGNGCTISQSVNIAEPMPLSANFAATPVNCTGGEDGTAAVIPAGGVAPYTYVWGNDQTDSLSTQWAAGEANVTITDANGCVFATSTTITEPEEAVALSLEQVQQGCFGEQANQVLATGSGGTGGYSYSWSNGQNTATAIGLDTISYTVTVTDGNGCTATADIVPEDLEDLNFLVIATPPSCNGFVDGRLGINLITGGNGTTFDDYTISWSTGEDGPITENLAGGITYSVTVSDGQGCEKESERFLADPIAITAELGADSVSCFGGEDGRAAPLMVQGDNPPFSYLWSDGQQQDTAANLSAGMYTLTITDDNGCMGMASITVPEPPELTASIATTDNDCFGDAIGEAVVSASGGTPAYAFSWSTGAVSRIATGLSAGGYDYTVTDANGCEFTALFSIEEPEPLLVDLSAEQPVCAGDENGSITAAPSGGTLPYRLSLDNDFFVGSNTLIGLASGTYSVYIRDAKGCTTFEEVTVPAPPALIVDAGPGSAELLLGDSIQLMATAENQQGFIQFDWTAPYSGTLSCTKCPDPVASPEYSILYELRGVDENGCTATDQIRIYVNKPRVVEVPTGFTPNGDGTNDVLVVHGQSGTQVLEFQVFDRWGEMVYKAEEFPVNDDSRGWDGSFRGVMLQPGVYVWKAIVEYEDGRAEAFSGQSTLIR